MSGCTRLTKKGLQLNFCSEPSSNIPARQMVHVHQKPVSQAKQTSCDKPQAFLNKSKDLDHVPLSKLPDAWLSSMRKLERFSFLHCNKSLLYTVPFCKSPKASFICLVQQLEAPEFPCQIKLRSLQSIRLSTSTDGCAFGPRKASKVEKPSSRGVSLSRVLCIAGP